MRILLVSVPAPAVRQTTIEKEFWKWHYALKEKLTYKNIPKRALKNFGNLENQNVGLLSIARVLLENNHKVSYLAPMPNPGLQEKDFFFKKILGLIKSKKIEMACFSAHTCAIPNAISFAKQIRMAFPDVLAVIGGPHANGAKGKDLEELQKNFDFVVQGPGEKQLLEIIAKTEGTKIKAKIPVFPFPANTLLNVKELPAARVFTSLGCRKCSQCVFCADIHNKNFVARPLEKAFEEIQDFYNNFNTRYVYFGDENFFFEEKRALKAIKKVKELDLRLDFGFQARITNASEKILSSLAASNKCSEVQFGIESANQEILNLSNKGLSFEYAKHVLAKAKKHGLTTHCYFLTGLPGETRETAMQTIRAMCSLLEKGLTDFVEYRIAVPFPGSPMYDQAEKYGIKILSRNWGLYRGENKPQHSLTALSQEQIYSLYLKGLEEVTKIYKQKHIQKFGSEKSNIAAQSAIIEGGF
ncbi:MAG: radical SAM protein [Candidatus ainarchaeum sp.]|nr:radical SAM protein [Candidatus ainarchaeum sp.]